MITLFWQKDSVVSELMYVLGKVGSGGSVDSTISASDSILQSNSGTVAAAMAEAIAIMNDLDSINGTILSNDLSELNLFEGIYEISGDAILNGTFHLYGDSTSTFVFKISDSLNVSQNSTMELHGVHPKNIFWRIEGHSNLEDSIIFYGILLSDSNITVSSNGGQLTLICETFIDIKNPISENYFKHIRSISNMFIPFQYVSLPTCNAPVFDCNYIINPGLESGAIPNDEDGFQLGWVDCWMNFMCNDGSGFNASPPTAGGNSPDILDTDATNLFGFRSCTISSGNFDYDSFGIPENTMCNSTPTLSSSAYATTNTRYSTMFYGETISGTLNKTLEPGFYITGFWSRATDCMCPNQEAAATMCINIFDTPSGTCNQDQIGFMNLWNLNKSTWEYHDACLDLTALTQLPTKNYIGFKINYPQGSCTQLHYSGRVLVDDFTLTKVADAGPDEVYCITDLDGIVIGQSAKIHSTITLIHGRRQLEPHHLQFRIQLYFPL
ncbi:MAG: DUF3494 domain-containing protein [Bacteroidetes bacterium]|nr:DUF3494 domain-containing protein [Bacteroidota bacterium]